MRVLHSCIILVHIATLSDAYIFYNQHNDKYNNVNTANIRGKPKRNLRLQQNTITEEEHANAIETTHQETQHSRSGGERGRRRTKAKGSQYLNDVIHATSPSTEEPIENNSTDTDTDMEMDTDTKTNMNMTGIETESHSTLVPKQKKKKTSRGKVKAPIRNNPKTKALKPTRPKVSKSNKSKTNKTIKKATKKSKRGSGSMQPTASPTNTPVVSVFVDTQITGVCDCSQDVVEAVLDTFTEQLNLNNSTDASQGVFATELVECFCVGNSNDTTNSTNNDTAPVRNLESSNDLGTSFTLEISKTCLDPPCTTRDEISSTIDDSQPNIENGIVSAVSNVTGVENLTTAIAILEQPSTQPSQSPTSSPTELPSITPSTSHPTINPTTTQSPSDGPTKIPTSQPSSQPSEKPSMSPSAMPSMSPTSLPSSTPSASPSLAPSMSPSNAPSVNPSGEPSDVPTSVPSASPSSTPSAIPSDGPTKSPTSSPTPRPTVIVGEETSAATKRLEVPSQSPSFFYYDDDYYFDDVYYDEWLEKYYAEQGDDGALGYYENGYYYYYATGDDDPLGYYENGYYYYYDNLQTANDAKENDELDDYYFDDNE